jgi:hypothetical protein
MGAFKFCPPQYFFWKDDDRINILSQKHNLSIKHSFWNNEIQSLLSDIVAWYEKG